MSFSLTVNGDHLTSTADPVTPLVDVLREDFHLTGAKPVCREGFCGACMVLIDGNPTPSCLMPVALAQGCDIRTVDAVQCGMCFPGMVVSLTHLLTSRPEATRDDIRAALTGNICRCTGYERIIEAALLALATT
jgi:carbon-monoxide dehydrogenase small subunit